MNPFWWLAIGCFSFAGVLVVINKFIKKPECVPDVKPLIRKDRVFGDYTCDCKTYIGLGNTPEEAYESWLRQHRYRKEILEKEARENSWEDYSIL